MMTQPLSRSWVPLAIACLVSILLTTSLTAAFAQQPADTGSANQPAAASPGVISISTDVHCSVKGLELDETPHGWVAKAAAGLSCAMQGRGPAGIKNVDFESKTLANGMATTKDFGEISLTVNGVPPGGGATVPDGGRIVETVFGRTPLDPAFLTIGINADRMSAFRAYLTAPSPFEAAVTSCSTPTAAAWPPNVKIKKQETVWRIVDLTDCSVHYAQVIDLEVRADTGLFMTFSGTITLTPNRLQTGAHVTSLDSWEVPVSVPGAAAILRGEVSGMAMLTSSPGGGVQQGQPQIHGGQGFLGVFFKDLGDKKKIAILSFIADTVANDSPAAPPLKD